MKPDMKSRLRFVLLDISRSKDGEKIMSSRLGMEPFKAPLLASAIPFLDSKYCTTMQLEACSTLSKLNLLLDRHGYCARVFLVADVYMILGHTFKIHPLLRHVTKVHGIRRKCKIKKV